MACGNVYFPSPKTPIMLMVDALDLEIFMPYKSLLSSFYLIVGTLILSPPL